MQLRMTRVTAGKARLPVTRAAPPSEALRFLIEEFAAVEESDDASESATIAMKRRTARRLLPKQATVARLLVEGMAADDFHRLRAEFRDWVQARAWRRDGLITLHTRLAVGLAYGSDAVVVESLEPSPAGARDVVWFYVAHHVARAAGRIGVCPATRANSEDLCGAVFLRERIGRRVFCSNACQNRMATRRARVNRRGAGRAATRRSSGR